MAFPGKGTSCSSSSEKAWYSASEVSFKSISLMEMMKAKYEFLKEYIEENFYEIDSSVSGTIRSD